MANKCIYVSQFMEYIYLSYDNSIETCNIFLFSITTKPKSGPRKAPLPVVHIMEQK